MPIAKAKAEIKQLKASGASPAEIAEKNKFIADQKAAMAARAEGKIVLVQKMNKNVGFQKQKLEADGYSKFIDIRYPDEMNKLEEI